MTITENHATQRIARLTPLAAVLARIDALVDPVAAREVALAAAVGRVVARDVTVAKRPATAVVLRDGWAVDSALTRDAGPYAPVPLPNAVWVDVGEPLPRSADAVAEIDTVVWREDRAEAVAAVTSGDGVLPAGADASGTAFAHEGQRLDALAAAALVATEASRVWIREPRVGVVGARPGASTEAAVDLLAHAIAAVGGVAVRESAGLEEALQRHDADAVIAVGGTGSGRHDASVTTVARLGRVETHGIALSPGETAAFGMVEARPVLLLPGRLDAVLAVWLTLGQRLLARLAASREEPAAVSAQLTRKVASNLGLAELIPVRLREGQAEPLGSGYLPLQTLAQSDGWILVPPDREGHPAGATVMVRPWP